MNKTSAKKDPVRMKIREAFRQEGRVTLEASRLAYGVLSAKLYRPWGFSTSADYCEQDLQCSYAKFYVYAKLYFHMHIRLRYPEKVLSDACTVYSPYRVFNCVSGLKSPLTVTNLFKRFDTTVTYGRTGPKQVFNLRTDPEHARLFEGLLESQGMLYGENQRRLHLNAAFTNLIDEMVSKMPDAAQRREAAEIT